MEQINSFIQTAEGVIVYKNENIVCKDCKYCLKEVARCKQYPEYKPSEVLNGEKCSYYQRK